MNCPKCKNREIEEIMAPNMAQIDICRSCYGFWLDKGEIFNYVGNAAKLQEMLLRAQENLTPSERACPRCEQGLKTAKVAPSGLVVDVCERCGGMWFDEGEIHHLKQILGEEIDSRKIISSFTSSAKQDIGRSIGSRIQSPLDMEVKRAKKPAIEIEPQQARPLPAAPGTPLSALPSLVFRSGAVMISLYAVLVAFLYILVAYFKVNPASAFLGAALIIALNFIFGPFLMDLSLKWFYKFQWAAPADLPEHLKNFISAACNTHGIPFPRCGIISDGNPNAFTYGHTPGDARLILTTGVIEMLDEKELEAVAGHELGHILHWDMLVMTLAGLVPLILYYIYRFCFRSARRGSGKKNPLPMIGVIAWILYTVTEYIALFLSRVREYHADRFAGQLTGKPNSLSSALIKIAYGLAGQRKATEAEESSGVMECGSVKTLGIFDPIGAKSLVASSLTGQGKVSAANILGAMQWDLWNPWAMYYELHSTHPLPAKRIELLGKQAASYGQTPLVHFNLQKPESYWDEFFVDVFMDWFALILVSLALADSLWKFGISPIPHLFLNILAAWAAGYIVKTKFSYKSGLFPDMTISSLLKQVKVSGVRGVPVVLKGRIIGRGIPGFFISEDMILQDDTGFIFLDYNQPLAIFNWLFALSGLPKMIGQEVTIRGWYRRSPVPYIELLSIANNGKTYKCYTLAAKYLFAVIVFTASVYLGLSGDFPGIVEKIEAGLGRIG